MVEVFMKGFSDGAAQQASQYLLGDKEKKKKDRESKSIIRI